MTDMHPIFIELKDVTGVTLMINMQNVNYIRPTLEDQTEIHFGTGHPITVLHAIDDIRRLIRTAVLLKKPRVPPVRQSILGAARANPMNCSIYQTSLTCPTT
jgi:hypothetical protein